MRTAAAVCLFCLTALTVSGRPDDTKTWRWPAEKAYRDGPVRLEVGSLVGEAGSDDWELSFRVTDPDTGAAAAGETNARFVGARAFDDRGADLPFARSEKTPRSLYFPRRPGGKARTVYVYFGAVADRPNVKLALPAATVRGLTARTSYHFKAAP